MLSVKQKLRIACAARGITMAQWARELGITPGGLDRIASGIRKSARIQIAIDDLIQTEFEKLEIKDI